MNPIRSLSIYRESLINSLWTLDTFPDELREFAAKERRFIEGPSKRPKPTSAFIRMQKKTPSEH
jgi:hypothetical protein